MRGLIFAGALAMLSAPALAAEKYTLDPSHSQVVFSYDHLGYSTTYGMFSGFEGEIMFDQDNPASSSVSVTFPVKSMFTGWEGRKNHFMSADFFNASDDDLVEFVSTSIEVTGEDTALITGNLTMNGQTKPVVLDTKLNKAAPHPRGGQPWLGFDATTQILRSDFGVGNFAPVISDEVDIMISVEAQAAESS